MFTKTISTLTVLGGLLSSTAMATDIKPYIGLEYQYIISNVSTIDGFNYNNIYDDKHNSFVPHAGIRIGDHLGLEVGYTKSLSNDQSFNGIISGVDVNSNIKTKLDGYTFDVNGYAPINKKFEILSQVGVGFYEVDVSGVATVAGSIPISLTDSEDTIAFRLSGGLHYNVNDYWSVRAMVRYIALDLETVDNAAAFSVGFGYNF